MTLKSDVPVTFKMHPVKCRVAGITFQLPPDEVADWHDCLRTVHWVEDTTRGPVAPGRWLLRKKVRSAIAKANRASTKRVADGSRPAGSAAPASSCRLIHP